MRRKSVSSWMAGSAAAGTWSAFLIACALGGPGGKTARDAPMGLIFGATFVVLAATWACVFWTVHAVEGDASPPLRLPVCQTAEAPPSHEGGGCGSALGILSLSFFPAFLCAYGAAGGYWLMATAVYAGLDYVFIAVILHTGDAYESFCQNVWPRLERERAEERRKAEEALRRAQEDMRRVQEQQAQAAALAAPRAEAERFYRQHRELLADAFPEALFTSRLNAAVPEGIEPHKAWDAMRRLIEQMQPLLASAREARRLEEKRNRRAEEASRRTRDEIGALQARIDALAGRANDEALDEMVDLQRQIARLQGRQLRRTVAPDDL